MGCIKITTTHEPYAGIFFDFDGVLADTIHVGMHILDKIALQKNISPLTQEFVRNHETKDIVSALHVRWWELPILTYKMRKWAVEIDPCAKLHIWSKELLDIASELFGETWIVSSNSKERILTCLKAAHIDLTKVHVYANVGFFHKHRLLKKIIRDKNLDPNKLIYVGDETRDFTAAQKSGMHFLGVSWGLHSAELLRNVSHAPVIEDPSEFKRIISGIISNSKKRG